METCCGSQLSSTWPLDIDLLIGLGVLGGALAVDIIFLNCAFNQPFFLAIRVSLVFLSHCLYPPSTCHCLMALFWPAQLANVSSIVYYFCLFHLCSWPVLALFLVQSFSFFSVSPIVYEGKQMYYRAISAWIISRQIVISVCRVSTSLCFKWTVKKCALHAKNSPETRLKTATMWKELSNEQLWSALVFFRRQKPVDRRARLVLLMNAPCCIYRLPSSMTAFPFWLCFRLIEYNIKSSHHQQGSIFLCIFICH